MLHIYTLIKKLPERNFKKHSSIIQEGKKKTKQNNNNKKKQYSEN